jgi:hypothetical protein
MKFIHRLAYYLFGFSIGLIFLFYFLGKKNTSCDYSPNARVKKNIRLKPRAFSEEAVLQMQQNNLDTAQISYLLLKGKVDFSKSNTNLDICNIYVIRGKQEDKKLILKVENCPEEAKIISFAEEF